MKKAYKKPEIMFESFASSTNIAGNCKEQVGSPSRETCAYVVEAGRNTYYLFSASIPNVCKTSEADMDDWVLDIYNSFCYHIPEGLTPLFNS